MTASGVDCRPSPIRGERPGCTDSGHSASKKQPAETQAVRLFLFLVIQVAHHLDPCLTGDASYSAGRLKTASAIERDARVIAGCDPESKTRRSTRPSPGDDALDQREANAAPARPAVNKHADQLRP